MENLIEPKQGCVSMTRSASLLMLGVWAATYAQNPTRLEFEVASVKPSPPPDASGRIFFGPPRGGPGTHDPVQITWTNASALNILTTAYKVTTLQIVAPDWISNQRYDIVAKIPKGVTNEQVAIMWQNPKGPIRDDAAPRVQSVSGG
jgi:hypothetical protein